MSNERLITEAAHRSALSSITYSERGKEKKNSPPNEVKTTYNDVEKSFFNLHRKILFYHTKEKRQDANFISQSSPKF